MTYKYEAVSESGVSVNGVIEAHDKNDAIIRVRANYPIINSMVEVRESRLNRAKADKKINEKNLSLVCDQFSILLKAGLPIVKTVEMIAAQVEDKTIKNILIAVAEDITGGYSLADSFEMRGPKLPTTFIETIRAGEESGSLEHAFDRLTKFFTKKTRVAGKVRAALAYPTLVIFVAVAVIIIIMTKAVPVFETTFADMGTELPGPTAALIAMSHFFQKFWIYGVAGIAVLASVWTLYCSTEQGAINKGKLNLKIPVIGKINRMNAASQFANTLATMMAAGLPVINSIVITGKAMTNYYVGSSIIDIVARLESGGNIADGLRQSGVMPNLLCEMTGVGEQTGSMEETLNVIGEYYDNEVELATHKAVSLIEPIIIICLAIFVVFVLLSVYMPMFSMYDGM